MSRRLRSATALLGGCAILFGAALLGYAPVAGDCSLPRSLCYSTGSCGDQYLACGAGSGDCVLCSGDTPKSMCWPSVLGTSCTYDGSTFCGRKYEGSCYRQDPGIWICMASIQHNYCTKKTC